MDGRVQVVSGLTQVYGIHGDRGVYAIRAVVKIENEIDLPDALTKLKIAA